MAKGVGVGFLDAMTAVTKQINGSLPTSFDVSGSYTANGSANGASQTEGLVNGLAAVMGAQGGGTYIIQNILDSKVISQTLFDPLKDVAKQRGVAWA